MEIVKILIVDDEQGMRLAVDRALRDFRVRIPDVDGEVCFAVEQAATGEEALEKIDAVQPHILLLDYKLPGMSGLDVLERIASRTGDMLTIMITAYASIETAVTATKQGAYDFLAKPFTPDELKNVIRKASGRIILLEQARKLAEEKRKVRFQFISVLVHELKAPLSAIEGYLRILDDHTIGDTIDSYDQVIDRSLKRLAGMRKMILDLLDMTHIESGEKQREFSEVDIVALARQSIETVQPDSNEHHITVILHNDTPVVMTADRGEVEIILNNLIANAVKYNRDNGSVDIAVADSGETVTITVSDTGIGMTQEEASRLFNDFVRIKNAKTKHILGSGLGLSTVRKIAMLYDGNVSVSSEPEVGSTFTVVLSRRR